MPDLLDPTRRTARVAPPSTLERPPDDELPLQLALGWIFLKATPFSDNGTALDVYSATFVADILAVIATEVFEVNPSPATFASLRAAIDPLVVKESARILRMVEKRRERGMHVSADMIKYADGASWLDAFQEEFLNPTMGCGTIDTIEREIRVRICDDDAVLLNTPEPLERLSPLGLYFRGVLVKLRKLTFNEVGRLSYQVAEWCVSSNLRGPEYDWRSGQTIEARDPYASAEARQMTRISKMEQHQAALASGDYVQAHQTLRAFYDYRAEMVDSGEKMLPHSLLNLGAFHYRMGGMESAREAIEEAIRKARKEGDDECLQQSLSLRQRIVTETESAAWPVAELPNVKDRPVPLRRLMHSVTPMDDLWSLKAAIDLGEPVPIAFRRVYTALGRTIPPDPVSDDEPRPVQQPLNTAAWHASQAGLWAMLGSETLTAMHEEMALSAPDLSRHTSIEIHVSRAQRAAQRGDFDAALSLLLAPSTIHKLDFEAYRLWVRGVWSVLDRQTSLSRDTAAQATLRGLRAPEDSAARFGPGGPVRDLWEPSAAPTEERGTLFAHGYVADTLALVRAQLDADPPAPPHLVLRDVLAALELAAGLGLWPLYRTGTVCLAETLLAMDVVEGSGMAAKADAELGKIWDELVAGPDAEALARAALARGKAHASMAVELGAGAGEEPGAGEARMDAEEGGEVDADHLARAVEFTDLCITTASALGAAAVLSQAALLRDMLTQLGAPSALKVENPPSQLSERVRRVGEIVRMVGVRVSEGWQ